MELKRKNIDGEMHRRCTKCAEWLPETTEFFHHDRNRPQGLARRCKACYADYPSVIRRNAERAANRKQPAQTQWR
ncbi:MAG: hypothetical protein Q4A06_02605 [Cardiobacteriaceae bacterium]|nr:hypothetical protein [Cardiobacteriaceae bacterium]